ncbi:sorting nexin-30 isoform X2 [Leopardus geoffroyi]|uniref:sorting nexin-30 isoform X2 n=1 Tax=Leopardus geoffroyi TaxID=46844 RepID=UPI001E2653AC|nr:sorting nexin-30 isoform X2 [Leopardus geoffroyi]
MALVHKYSILKEQPQLGHASFRAEEREQESWWKHAAALIVSAPIWYVCHICSCAIGWSKSHSQTRRQWGGDVPSLWAVTWQWISFCPTVVLQQVLRVQLLHLPFSTDFSLMMTLMSTRVEFDLPEYSVRRRYQDFDWLRNKLEESQPTHLIPPLPEKFVVKGVVDRFSEEFVETRRKALDKFLKRITDHPVLSFNEHFNVFLTAKDLNAYKRQGMALLSRVGESVKHVTGGYKLRSRPLEFAAIGDYLDTFALKLGTIDRIAQRIIKEEIEYLVELREYGPVYSTWSALEGELAEPLEGVSACIGNCSTALEELTDDMTEDFLPVLREYILYSDSMKSVLKKRDQVQAEYEAKLEAVALRKEDRPKVPADVEKCQDRMECFNADLKADMERWQSNKRQDFRQLLMGMADKNIQYYEKCLMAWESIIPLLQEKPEANGSPLVFIPWWSL